MPKDSLWFQYGQTVEGRLGENPFVISKDIVNTLTEKIDWDTQKNIRTLEQSWNLHNQSPVKPHLFQYFCNKVNMQVFMLQKYLYKILCMPNALKSNKSSPLHTSACLYSPIDCNYLTAFEEDKQV